MANILQNFKLSKPDFFYPTTKNVLQVFTLLQLIPCLVFLVNDGETTVGFWVKFEAIVIALICYWPLRPEQQMSADDRAADLKWTNRMFSLSLPCLLVPVVLMAVDPETTAWTALNSFAAPVAAIVIITCTLTKREQGGFFAVQEVRAEKEG